MTVIEDRQAPFEIVKIYSQKVISNKAKAALRRVIRNNNIRESDRNTFMKLHELLNAAISSDQSISSTQIRATSRGSLKILSQSCSYEKKGLKS